MRLKVGNSANLLFQVQDADGAVIQNLSTATAIKFMVKVNAVDDDDDAVISKDLTDGVTRDYPSIGYINVALSDVDTGIYPGKYYIALQIEWSNSKQELLIKETKDEITITNTVNFMQDVIR